MGPYDLSGVWLMWIPLYIAGHSNRLPSGGPDLAYEPKDSISEYQDRRIYTIDHTCFWHVAGQTVPIGI